jgi:hypothetical protein
MSQGGTPIPAAAAEQGFVTDSLILSLIDSTTTTVVALAAVAGRDLALTNNNPREGVFHVFTPKAVWGTAHSSLWIADNRRFELRELTLDGTLARIIRAPVLDIPLPKDSIDAQQARWRDQIARRPSAPTSNQLEFARFPPLIPLIDAISQDEDGNIWVKRLRVGSCFVFTSRGELLGSVDIPQGSRLMGVGRDYMLLMQFDSLDVQSVALRRLIK